MMRSEERVRRTEVLLAVFALAIMGCSGHGSDPEYSGRRLSDWVQDLKLDGPGRQDGARHIIQQAGERAVPHLLVLINGGDARTRVSALGALDSVCCDKTAALPALRPLLKDIDARVRVSAAGLISLIEGRASPEVLQVLVVGLESEDSFVSWNAAWTLKRLGPKAASATGALAAALKHRDRDTRLEQPMPWARSAPLPLPRCRHWNSRSADRTKPSRGTPRLRCGQFVGNEPRIR
jgi:hypothetical protein